MQPRNLGWPTAVAAAAGDDFALLFMHPWSPDQCRLLHEQRLVSAFRS
jgi:hypothetical protein